MQQQQTFVAQLIYRILCGGVFEEQYEEQWRLVFAPDERTALAEARRIGASEETMFADRHGRMIQWQLIAVKDLQAVALQQGSLLASAVRELEPVTTPVWADL